MSNTAPTNIGGRIPQWTLADRLVKARRAADLEQDELAEAIGIARSSLSSYENGHREPRRPVLLSWAMATGVPIEWLMTGQVDTGPDDPSEQAIRSSTCMTDDNVVPLRRVA